MSILKNKKLITLIYPCKMDKKKDYIDYFISYLVEYDMVSYLQPNMGYDIVSFLLFYSMLPNIT